MKTILINPAFNIPKAKYESSISVGLLCLASYLDERGLPVKIIDCARQPDWQRILNEELPSVSYVGFSVMTTQIPSAIEISRFIKEKYPQIKIIWGGAHPTLFPEQVVENDLIDFAVIGEGEETLYELIKQSPDSSFEQLQAIKGLAFKNQSGQIILTEKRPFLSMENIPLPHWNLMPSEVLESLKLIPTHTSRGCPHRCAFCINAITKNRWRGRTVEEVLEDLKRIKKYFVSPFSLRFWDENFFVDLERAKKIIQGMIEHNLVLPWETTMRVDYCSRPEIDEEFFENLRKSGCYLLSFGAESGSAKILNKIDKDISREQIIDSAKKCLRYNIIPQYSFMVGLPGEDYQDIRQTIDLIDELLALDKRVQILGPQAFRPYPGSKLYEECLKAGWKAPQSLEEWAEAVKDELNYLTPYRFPWVKNPGLVDSLEAYVRFGAHSFKSALSSTVKANKLLKIAFILLSKLRWKLKFFAWPWEIKIAKKYINR